MTIAAVNDAPVAVADTGTTMQNAPLVSPTPGPLANDTDADGDPLTAVLVGPPSSGALTLAADGSYVYTPYPGFVGTDSFTYAASDGVLQQRCRRHRHDQPDTGRHRAGNPLTDR